MDVMEVKMTPEVHDIDSEEMVSGNEWELVKSPTVQRQKNEIRRKRGCF